MKHPTPRLRKAFAICLLLGLSTARADDAPDAAFNQWQEAFDAAGKRVGEQGSLREALNEAGKNAGHMRDLAKACKERLSDLEAAAFQVKFWKGEWERAQAEVKRKSDAKDQKYAELMAEIKAWGDAQKGELTGRDKAIRDRQARLHEQSKPLDDWLAKDNAWKVRVDALFAQANAMPKDQQNYPAYISAWNAAEAERQRCSQSIQGYNQAIIPWNAENQKIKDDIVALDAAWAKLSGDWDARMEKIRKFAVEEGKLVLEAQAVASKKEREYREHQEKHAKLTATQKAESTELAGLLGSASATLQVVVDALNAPPPTPASVSAPAGPYAPRESETSARAAALPPAEAKVGGTPGVRSRILVLPAPEAASSTDHLRHRLQTEAAAKVLATQYAPVAKIEAKPADPAPVTPAATDATAPAPAPAAPAPLSGALGPAPLGPADGPGDGAVRLSDEALTRAFDPRVFISDAQYQSAQAALERYGPLVPKLREQLEKLRLERGKTAGYNAEFAAMRREIQLNAIGDVLSIYASALKLRESHLKEAIAFEGNATKRALLEAQNDRFKRLRQAVETAKLDASRRQAERTADPMDQRKLRHESVEDGLIALSEIGADALGGREAQFATEQLGNVLKFYGTVTRAQEVNPDKTKGEQFQEKAQVPIKIASLFCVPVSLGMGLEGLGERGVEWAVTKDAVDSLNASVKSQDDAIIYLSDRLTRAELIVEDSAKTVHDYRAVPERRRKGFQLGQ